MRTPPALWEELFNAHHITEYYFEIDGTIYEEEDVRDTPIIERNLTREPVIGRCCTGSLTLTVQPKFTIPRTSTVVAFCRLRSGNIATSWMEMGQYWVSRRSGRGGLVTLTCRDAMIFAGSTYADKTGFEEWPQPMPAVLEEIAGIMGVGIDSRTLIHTTADFVVNYPNEDTMISEVLSVIAATHGGNFVITETGQLRLIPLLGTNRIWDQLEGTEWSALEPYLWTDKQGSFAQSLEEAYVSYRPYSTGVKTISRITLADSAGNQFTSAGNLRPPPVWDELAVTQWEVQARERWYALGPISSIELGVECDSATQGIVDELAASLIGRTFLPYALSGAYLDPLMEVGDVFSIDWRGETLNLIAGSIKARCNVSFSCDLQNGVEDDDEDEYPYLTNSELRASRFVDTRKSYYGNRIDRKNGLVSELMVDGEPTARLVANGTMFTMQRNHNGAWEDCIYFDAVNQKYRLTGDVDVQGVLTVEDLATSGKTIINGDNITTGTIKAQQIQLEGIMTANQNFKILSDGSMEAVNGKFSGELQGASGTFSGELRAAIGTFAGTLTAGPWRFDNNGILYSNGANQIRLAIQAGSAQFTASGYDVEYGGDLNREVRMRAHDIRFAITTADTTAAFTKTSGSYNYQDICFICEQGGNSWSTARGNLGTTDNRWDVLWVRVAQYDSHPTSSSRAKKRDIQKLPDMGDVIDRLNPVSFEYLDDREHRKRMGLIYEEALEVLRVIVKEKNPDKVIMAGTGRESAWATIEFTKRAADAGADFASVLTPHYYAKKMNDEALIRFFTEVADKSPIPVLMYCAPAFAAGVIISCKAVSELAKHMKKSCKLTQNLMTKQEVTHRTHRQCVCVKY